jgi:hypothetical protein
MSLKVLVALFSFKPSAQTQSSNLMSAFPTILAFGFVSPWLLWGLVLAGIPIVVHLLHKRRYHETQWAAMRFLLEAARKNAKRIRLEQLLLLTVRTLILVLLVLGLAQPFVESLGGYLQADVAAHRIIVVDASFSMGYQADGFSRFDRAKAAARQIASDAKQGDALNLIRITGHQPTAIVRQPAFQKNQVLQEIEQMRLTDQRGDVLASVRTAEELLQLVPEIGHKEVYLISDFQRENWSPEGNGRAVQIRRSLQNLSEHAHLVTVDLSLEPASNTAITSFTADDALVTIGRPTRLSVSVKNFGGETRPGRTLELYVDGQLVQSRQVDLPAGAEVSIDFEYEFRNSGDFGLEARLQDDGLSIDNRRWLALPVKSELNVLLVNGKYSGRDEETATYYVRKALSPSVSGRDGEIGVIHPQVVNEGELTGIDLSRFDCIFLCNITLFTQAEADVLRAYAESGGGLVFCLGDEVQPDNYNLLLYEGGEGILPARLGNRVGNARQPTEAFHFDTDNPEHPIIADFQGNPGTGLETTLTFEYFQAVLPEKGQARTALRFDTGDPAILEMPVGRGRSILVTTAVDNRWSTWAVNASFLPVMHETVYYAASGRWGERRLLVGETLTGAFPTRAFDMPASIELPDGRTQPLRVTDNNNFCSIHFDSTHRSGLYAVHLGPPLSRTELYAVNVDVRESDLADLDQKQLQTELLPGVEFAYRTQGLGIERAVHASVGERGGLARWLLLAALCLLFVEQLMAWNFFYGFLLLYAVVACGFVRQALLWNTTYGSLLLIVFAVGFAVITGLHRWRPSRRRSV